MSRIIALRSVLRRCIVAAAGASLLAYAALFMVVYRSEKPLLVNIAGGSQAVYDRDGQLLRLSLSSDDKYRVWIPLRDMAPSFIEATLLYEDQHFFRHIGVNPYAIVRAALTTYVTGGARTGGSTISMQLARLRFALRTRGVRGKLTQILRALELERHYSKTELLEAYLNLAPYGENIEGIGAASRIYFNKFPSELNLIESLTLAVVPQNPIKRRPSGTSATLQELTAVRERLFDRWSSSHHDDDARSAGIRLPLRPSRRSELGNRAPHFVDQVLARNIDRPQIRTTLDSGSQDLVERSVREFVSGRSEQGITNAAAILIDWRTMEVQALVGSADYKNALIRGQVNGTRARRSPGSALKPFVYALAIDQGLIVPASILKDTPASFAAYDPENFDRDFLGPISATDALVRSRNLPAVQLANQLHGDGFYGFLRDAGIQKLREPSFYGLSLTLGGAEVSLQEMVRLYAMLANGGKLRPLVFTKRSRAPREPMRQIVSPEAAYIVLDMLSHNPRPGESPVELAIRGSDASWKTGTSFGFRDAWAVGVAGQHVLGVWVGNFQGNGNPAFVGRESAGQLFFQIVDAIRLEGRRQQVVRAPGPLHLRKVRVCAVSGQLPGPFCKHLIDTWFIPGKSPIATCSVHREIAIDDVTGLRACDSQQEGTHREVYEFWPTDLQAVFRRAGLSRRNPPPFRPECQVSGTSGDPPEIVSPQRGIVYQIRLAHLDHAHGDSEGALDTDEPIPLRATADADARTLYWFVNEELVGSVPPSEPLMWKPSRGHFVVRVVDDQGRGGSRPLDVQIIE